MHIRRLRITMMTKLVLITLWLSVFTIGVQCQSLKGANMIVTTVLDVPYTMLRDTPQSNLTGNDRYEGYIVDLVDAIATRLHFNYVLKVNEAGSYGSIDRSGKWNGMIGELIDGRTHIAAGAMTITSERENVVDFTVPFMNVGIGVIYKSELYVRPLINDFGDLFFPFRFFTTDTFAVLTLVFGIVLLILRRKYKTIIFRTLLGLWLLFLFIFAALYIAQLSSYFASVTTNNMKIEEFHSIEELAAQSRVAYGCIRSGSTEAFFRNSDSPVYSRMWERMSNNPDHFVTSSTEGIERVEKGGYAFLAESTVIEYATSRSCDLYQVGGLIDSKGFDLAVQQGSSMRKALSAAILALQEQGVLAQLKRKWWEERRGGGAC